MTVCLTKRVNVVSPGTSKTVLAITVRCLTILGISHVSVWTCEALPAILNSESLVTLTGGKCSAFLDGNASAERLSTIRNGSQCLVNKAANVGVLRYSRGWKLLVLSNVNLRYFKKENKNVRAKDSSAKYSGP